MDNSLQNSNIRRYCKKCLSLLDNNIVRDYDGREFCSNFCRSEYYAEIRKENNCLYNEWVGSVEEDADITE